jgi:hypothetical protein
MFAAHEAPSAIGAALRDGLQCSCHVEPARAGRLVTVLDLGTPVVRTCNC